MANSLYIVSCVATYCKLLSVDQNLALHATVSCCPLIKTLAGTVLHVSSFERLSDFLGKLLYSKGHAHLLDKLQLFKPTAYSIAQDFSQWIHCSDSIQCASVT